MGKCGSKGKKRNADDVEYKDHVEGKTGIIVLNIVADNVSIGSAGNVLKFRDDKFQNSNIEDMIAKVCQQESLTEVYVPTNECTDGKVVTSSRALNQEPFNAEKEIDKLCKEETDERASSCQTMTEKLKTGSTLPKQTGTSSSHGSSTGVSSCQTMTEKLKTDSTLPKQTGTSSSHGSSTDASSCQTMTEKLKTGSTLPMQTGTSSSHGSSTDASSCQTMTEKLKTGSTLPMQTGTSSSHGSSTDASSCQTMTEKLKTDSTLPKQTGTSSSHGSLTGSLEQDGSVFPDLGHLSSEDSNDSTIQCDINRVPTNDVDKLKDYTIINKRSDFESSTINSQLFGPNMTSITTEGSLRSSENSPITEHQSSVNPGNCRTEDNERNSVGDGEVGENQEEEEEHQEVEENQGEVTQAGEEQEEEHQEQENQAEDQEEENQQEEHQEQDLEVEVDSEPSQEPAIIDDISVGNNNNLNDQQLKEKNASCDVMETIKMVAIDVGQNSMNKNYDIAMTGNDEVKIENGRVIGSTAHIIAYAIRDIAIQSMKLQQSF